MLDEHRHVMWSGEVHQHFEGAYLIHLQVQLVSPARSKYKSKAIPVTGCGDQYNCEILIPRCLGNQLTEGDEAVRLTRQLHSTPQKQICFLLLVLISVRGLSQPKGLLRLERLGKLRNFMDLIESQNPSPSGL
jgi:hypothetical protein